MKLGIYDVINNPLPELLPIKEITVNKDDFEYVSDIVNIMNKHLYMDKLDSEHMYVLSLTYGLIPKGIIQISIGNNEECVFNLRGLGIGLLLTGAEQFMIFHNHPGGNRIVSDDDQIITEKCKELGDVIGIPCINHIMITKGFYDFC